jgi:RimJ/RimL family protein N-acetyltransferase
MPQETTPNWQPGFLKNETVILKPVEENDFEALYRVAADPAIWEQHPERDRYKREVFQQYFNSAIASQSAFLILDKPSGNLIGSTRFYDYRANPSSIAIGFTFLAKAYWGGVANKAVKQLMLDYAFQFVDRVFFHIGAENIRSQKAIVKLSAKKVREYQKEHRNVSEVHYEYALEKSDWFKT